MPSYNMRKIVILAGICISFTATLVFAQSADEFDAWMRTIDEKNQSVQRNIAAKDSNAVTADAQGLLETFKLVEGFWKQRGNAPDAVELSKKAQELAGEVIKFTTAKDFDGASVRSIRIAETCTACHRLYRPL